MKFVFERGALLGPLQVIQRVVERRQNLPILGNVLLVADGSNVSLTATDMEVEVRTSFPGANGVSGSTTLPARKLFDLCRALPDGASIELNIDDKQAVVKSGRSRFTLATMPAADFPSIGAVETGESFQVEAAALAGLIDATHFAMAHQDVRYYLNGMLFELTPTSLRTVATDGHRLAWAQGTLSNGPSGNVQVIVPRKGVQEIARLAEAEEGELSVFVNEQHLQVSSASTRLASKLIDGKFPDYDRVIPAATDKTLISDRESLRQALARASILSNEKFRGIRLILGENTLRAVAHNPEQEEAEEEIEIQYGGGDLEIGFNVSYLLDVLGAVNTEMVKVELSDAGSSCLITPHGEDSTDEARYVVMPMRL